MRFTQPKRSDPSSSKPASEASPVLCLKEHCQYITVFESEDYSLGFYDKSLKGLILKFGKTWIKLN